MIDEPVIDCNLLLPVKINNQLQLVMKMNKSKEKMIKNESWRLKSRKTKMVLKDDVK